jgi:hypothetical protein
VALSNCVVASFLLDSSDLACTRRGFLLFSSAFRRWIAVKIFLGRGSGVDFSISSPESFSKTRPGVAGEADLGAEWGSSSPSSLHPCLGTGRPEFSC